MPRLNIVAGANGSGKSTLTKGVGSPITIIDPDAIARTLDPDRPEKFAMQAGRIAKYRSQQYIKELQDFTIETTLSGNHYLQLMSSLKQQGWQINLLYIGIDNPETSIRRVAQRVAQGGHNVPISDIRRRYQRSLNNLPKAIAIADTTTIYDNSSLDGYTLIATIVNEVVSIEVDRIPDWFIDIYTALA